MDFCRREIASENSLWRMSKTFRPWDVEQRVLLSVHELVRPGTWHVSYGIRFAGPGSVAIVETHRGARLSAYHPTMMVAFYFMPTAAARTPRARVAQACEERVDFIVVTAINRPDHPYDRQVSAAASEVAGRLVRAGAQAVPGSRAGQARACGAGQHQDAGQCQRAQGDVLWADPGSRKEAFRRGLGSACPRRGHRCGGRS